MVKDCVSSFVLAAVGAAASQAVAASELVYPIGSEAVIEPYGQFHFAKHRFDDGVQRSFNLVDNSNANSRFGFHIHDRDRSDGLSFHFETGLGFRPSQRTNQDYTPPFWDWDKTDLRKLQLIHKSELGTLKFGQGSMPLDGAAESDLGKTTIVAKSTIPESYGAYIFRTAAGTRSDIDIGDTFDNFDGSRRLRARYDTPSVHGFSLGIAFGREVLKPGVDDNYYDLALRYSNDIGRLDFKAAMGIGFVGNEDGHEQTMAGSISILDKPTGLNFSFAAGYEDDSGATYTYLKAGWNADFFAFGTTKFVTEGFWGSNYVTHGADSQMWGAAIIQEINEANTEIYLGYRAFSYNDLLPVSYRDTNAFQFGTRFRF
jgi:hypothetical protein